MKKEIISRIKHVMFHLGAKKQLIKKLLDESENLGSGFIEAGELPLEAKASPEIQKRFNDYMQLERKVDLWYEDKLDQLYGMPEKNRKLLEVVHQDALNFINLIDTI